MSREELHRLVDELPANEVEHGLRYLKYLHEMGEDPVRHALENAPDDDEPETDEEREGVQEAESDIRAGRTMSTDELKRELGL